MPTIKHQGVNLHYETRGQGQALVLLHPNGHNLKDWESLGYVSLLEKDFQLVLIDLRGFGESDKPHDSAAYSGEIQTGDVIAILNALGIQQAKVFGYSMGGRLALALMQYYPQYFTEMMIGGAHPFAHNKLLDSYLALLKQGIPAVVASFEKHFGPFPAKVKEEFLKNDVEALIAANSLPLVDYSEALKAYPSKVSFIVGEKDPILLYVKQAHEMKQGSELRIIPKQNHMDVFFSAEAFRSPGETRGYF